MGKRMRRFGIFAVVFSLFMLFAGDCFAPNGYNISGSVVTLPVTFGIESGLTPVGNMPVIFNEQLMDITQIDDELTQDCGDFFLTVTVPDGSQYILRADDDVSVGDEIVNTVDYITSYTVPSMFNGYVDGQDVMVFTSAMITELLDGTGVAWTSGTGILVAIAFEYYDGLDPLYGAEVLVRDMDGNAVGDVLYISPVINGVEAGAQQIDLGVELVSAPTENTMGFVVVNLDPGPVMISATHKDYEFIWRPAFIYADSITSGISPMDGIIGEYVGELASFSTVDIEGTLVDETGAFVEDAVVEICGLNIESEPTDAG
jgi:hypothetical protein